MKYKDLDIKQVKKCCKQQAKVKGGKFCFECETCPLRRTRIDKEGKERTLFCYYVMRNMYEKCEKEYKELEKEQLQHEKEWEEWVKNNLDKTEE